MAQIVWPQTILDILFDLPGKERGHILEKVERLANFPEMYRIRAKGPFRGHRWFFSGN